MKRFQEALQEVRDQIALASGEPTDRPTSLYQSGAGGREQRRREPSPAEGPPVDAPSERRRRDAETRRAAEALRRETQNRPGAFRELLSTPMALRSAIVVSEVLGPPVSLKNDRRRQR